MGGKILNCNADVFLTNFNIWEYCRYVKSVYICQTNKEKMRKAVFVKTIEGKDIDLFIYGCGSMNRKKVEALIKSEIKEVDPKSIRSSWESSGGIPLWNYDVNTKELVKYD